MKDASRAKYIFIDLVYFFVWFRAQFSLFLVSLGKK